MYFIVQGDDLKRVLFCFFYLFSFLLIGRLARKREIGGNCCFVFDFVRAKREIGAGMGSRREMNSQELSSLPYLLAQMQRYH